MAFITDCLKKQTTPISSQDPVSSVKQKKLDRVTLAVRTLAFLTLAAFIAIIVTLGLAQGQILPPTGAFYSFIGFTGLFITARVLYSYQQFLKSAEPPQKSS